MIKISCLREKKTITEKPWLNMLREKKHSVIAKFRVQKV